MHQKISLYDVCGRQISREIKINVSRAVTSVRDLKNGIYFVRVKTAEGIVVKKITVQH